VSAIETRGEFDGLARPVLLLIPSRHTGPFTRQAERLVRHYTGMGSATLVRKGAPIRYEGAGTGKRRYLLLDEFIEWIKTVTDLERV
jgi:hypothetical protein